MIRSKFHKKKKLKKKIIINSLQDKIRINMILMKLLKQMKSLKTFIIILIKLGKKN